MDLIFLGAYRAVGHTVYLGKLSLMDQEQERNGTQRRRQQQQQQHQQLSPVASLIGEENIVHPPAGGVEANAKYVWRVDAHFADRTTDAGETWQFTAGTNKACAEQPPPPSPPPPHVIPAACLAAMESCCSDVQGKGKHCMNHIKRHHKTLVPPKCDCTVVDENQFCYN